MRVLLKYLIAIFVISLIINQHNFDVNKLINRDIDALSACSTDEHFILKEADIDYTIISTRMGGNDFYGDVLFTTEALNKKKPEMADNFRQASLIGWNCAMQIPWKMIAIILIIFLIIGSVAFFLYKTSGKLKIEVSRRLGIEKKIHDSEQRYRLLIETANEGILVAQGSYLKFVNSSMLELTGYTKEELMVLPFLEFVHTDDRDLVISNQQKRLKGDPVDSRYQIRILKNDKSIIWVEMSGVKIEWEGEPATMNFVTDISDRKKREMEIKLKNDELMKINAEKDKFFSIIAHDLRSPFNGFLGLTQIMAEELPSLTMAEIQEIAVSMRNSATNLFRLLENLLQWSRIQQGLIPFEPADVNLLPIVEESIAMVVESAKAKEIGIANDISDELTVFADTNILHTVIRNLVSNAVKFTPKGGAVTLSARPINDNTMEISVKDTGIGMSSGMIDHLFRLDVQTDRSGTEGEPSTGLGLLLCKEFVERHNGRLWVDSEEGKGSTFYFTLPYNANNP